MKDALPRTQIFLLYLLLSKPHHLPLEAGETGFFQECVGRIAKGAATVDTKINYFWQYADEN